MTDGALFLWAFFIFVPLLLFAFNARWRFFAIALSCAILCFQAISNITLINNENLWGLLQTEITVSKSVFVVYQSVLICLFILLLFIAYRYKNIRTIIFICFMLCNVLLPFSIVEKLLFGF